MSTRKGFHVHARVYLAVAERYCRMGASDKVLAVLKDMTEHNHEPSPTLCEPLLNAAMLAADVPVLRVLLSWYKSNFNMGLLDGQTTHVLSIAANKGDAQLALTAFQVRALERRHPRPCTSIISHFCYAP
jgi:pentatricopeptide repeat protein